MKPRLLLSIALATAWATTSAALASATVPTTGYFNPAQADVQTNTGIALTEDTASQSFGYDDTTNILYTAQRWETSWDDDAEGNLTITRVDNASTSTKYGHMNLRGFGHGVSIGVEPNPGSTASPRNAFLWVECMPPTPVSGVSARGTRLCRLSFHAGWTVSYKWSSGTFSAKDGSGAAVGISVAVFNPVSGATAYTANLDMKNSRAIVRYNLNGGYRLRAYNLSDLRASSYGTYLADRAQPSMSTLAALYPASSQAAILKQDFQGYAMYGNWVYLLHGNDPDGSLAGKSQHTFISALDLNTGTLKSALTPADEKAVAAAVGYSAWEAEGMAIRLLPTGAIRLRWGLALGTSANTKKLAILEKQVLS